jgi:hypothetical protein
LNQNKKQKRKKKRVGIKMTPTIYLNFNRFMTK